MSLTRIDPPGGKVMHDAIMKRRPHRNIVISYPVGHVRETPFTKERQERARCRWRFSPLGSSLGGGCLQSGLGFGTVTVGCFRCGPYLPSLSTYKPWSCAACRVVGSKQPQLEPLRLDARSHGSPCDMPVEGRQTQIDAIDILSWRACRSHAVRSAASASSARNEVRTIAAASTSKCSRSSARESLRPKPSVPRVT